MPHIPRIDDEQAAYLKALMRHIANILDNDREAVLSTDAVTELNFGTTTTFRIEVECIGNQVMKGDGPCHVT